MISETILNINDLNFSYDGKSTVLHISALKVAKGEKVFIFGPSGSGKTTLLGLLAGVIATQKGKIEILGENISNLSAPNRDKFRGNHIGYIFQMFNLIPYLNVAENILLPFQLNPSLRKKILNPKQKLLEMAKSMGIEALLSAPITKLSVGQQQRVAAARALIGAPEIIIADEPTSALDFDHREKFLSLLFSECQKNSSTLIFVSHDRSLEHLFDRAVSLESINK